MNKKLTRLEKKDKPGCAGCFLLIAIWAIFATFFLLLTNKCNGQQPTDLNLKWVEAKVIVKDYSLPEKDELIHIYPVKICNNYVAAIQINDSTRLCRDSKQYNWTGGNIYFNYDKKTGISEAVAMIYVKFPEKTISYKIFVK